MSVKSLNIKYSFVGGPTLFTTGTVQRALLLSLVDWRWNVKQGEALATRLFDHFESALNDIDAYVSTISRNGDLFASMSAQHEEKCELQAFKNLEFETFKSGFKVPT